MTDLSILDAPVLAPAFEVWGLATVSVSKVTLIKGQGKVPFDPAAGHKNMVYAIDLAVLPIAGQEVRPIERNMIQTSDEWKLVQESIQATGTAPSEINAKYVKVSFQQTGETYKNREGETKNKTYIHFDKVFVDEASCTQDYLQSQYAPSLDTAKTDGSDAGQAEFETAKKLVEATIRNAVKIVQDPDEVKALVLAKIDKSPVMNRFYNADSPELPDMINAALGA